MKTACLCSVLFVVLDVMVVPTVIVAAFTIPSSTSTTAFRNGATFQRSVLLPQQGPQQPQNNHDHQHDSARTRLYSSLSSSGQQGNKNDDPIVRLPLMQAELAVLVANEKHNGGGGGIHSDDDDDDFGDLTANSRKMELQQAIQDAETAAELGVRRAQVAFYDAFSNSDLEAMKQVWSSTSGKEENGDDSISGVRCIHPGMKSLDGIDAIMKSWEQIFRGAGSKGGGFTISPTNVHIDICGPTAICSCVEETSPGGGELEALNIYRREDGQWRMTLHMASPILMPRGDSAMF
mmetsp:Transcript_11863/g.18353  ORF Transcript_11863/g.18353 Transcript_11863/m.18353 type:complete len:292 (-) Transcript_11863:50-925(-)